MAHADVTPEGRVRYSLLAEDGTPVLPSVCTKSQLLRLLKPHMENKRAATAASLPPPPKAKAAAPATTAPSGAARTGAKRGGAKPARGGKGKPRRR
jgi:hypothetical protein